MKEETIEKRRKAVEKYRSGEVTLQVPFAPGEMMFVKECPICHEPGRWTGIAKFACAPCRYLYN